jgi:hypothetical protein
MKIDNVCINNYKTKTNANNRTTPSFQAIHPTRYYLKCADGQYRKITSNEIIQYLQKKIISWLNKATNDNKRIIEGNPKKVNHKETPQEQAMRLNLERFFIANDKDYASRRFAKSVYLGSDNYMQPYILTGKTIDFANDGKSIGKAHKQINESRQYAQTYYGLDAKEAEQYVSPSAKMGLAKAKEEYHRENENLVSKLMRDKNMDTSTVNFYFTTVPDGKKSRPKYQLVEAIWQKYMMSRL